MSTETTVRSATSDGYVYGYSATYSTARSTAYDVYAAGALNVGQFKSDLDYYCMEAFLNFDTSEIPEGAEIISAVLKLYGSVDNTTTDFILEARAHDWGDLLANSDWVPGADLGDSTLVAHHATSGGWATDAYTEFTDDDLAAHIVKGGTTRLLICSDRHRAGTQPSGREDGGFHSAEQTGAPERRPTLVITWEPGPIEGAIAAGLPPFEAYAIANGGWTMVDLVLPALRVRSRATGPAPLPPPPMEFHVYAAGGESVTMLATLVGACDRGFTDVWQGIGSGNFLIPASDPNATAAILAQGNLVMVWLNGAYRFSFWIESARRRYASPDGQAGEYWSIGGRSTIAYLERGLFIRIPPETRKRDDLIPPQEFATRLIHAQNQGFLPHLTKTFVQASDSNSEAWTAMRTTAESGVNFLNFWKTLIAMGLGSTITPGIELSLYNAPQTTDLTGTVIFRAGKHFREALETTEEASALRTRVTVYGLETAGVPLEVEVISTDLNEAVVGRWPGFVDFPYGEDTDILTAVGQAYLDLALLQNKAMKVPVLHGSGPGEYEPYVDYGLGSIVGIDVADSGLTSGVVSGITIRDGTGGDYEVELDLNSTAMFEEARLKRLIDDLARQRQGLL